MDDPLGDARRLQYRRLVHNRVDTADDSLAGLFTRPAQLAERDGSARSFPVSAMNLACRLLLNAGAKPTASEGITSNNGDWDSKEFLADVAALCGYSDFNRFARAFRRATGWDPAAWMTRFRRLPFR